MTQQERDEAMNLPLVREIADRFEARLVDLRPRPPLHQPPPADPHDAPGPGDAPDDPHA